MLAVCSHLKATFRVVAVAAHSRRVIVQVYVRTLSDSFAVLDDDLLINVLVRLTTHSAFFLGWLGFDRALMRR